MPINDPPTYRHLQHIERLNSLAETSTEELIDELHRRLGSNGWEAK